MVLLTEKDHAEGKPSSRTPNNVKVNTEDDLTYLQNRHLFLNNDFYYKLTLIECNNSCYVRFE
jgi:hypothetical protein